MSELESLASAAGEAVHDAWEGGGEFDNALSINGEMYGEFAAGGGRAAPLVDYTKLLSAQQSSARTASTGDFGNALGGLRPGRTAGFERVYPERDPSALDNSGMTDLYTERPVHIAVPQTGSSVADFQPHNNPRQSPPPVDVDVSAPVRLSTRVSTKASKGRHKVDPERSEARSHVAREQTARDTEKDELSAKAAYQSELNAVRRNVAADRSARQAAERRVQSATRQAQKLREAEEAAASAAAAAQRELATERQMRSKAEARARVLTQKVVAASKAKALSKAKTKAQERQKTLAAKRATLQATKRRSKANTGGPGGSGRNKHDSEADGTQDVQLTHSVESQGHVAVADDKLAVPSKSVAQHLQATIPTAAPSSAADEMEARTSSTWRSSQQSGSGQTRQEQALRKRSVSDKLHLQQRVPHSPSRARQRASEQEARTIERLRESAQNRVTTQQTNYEYMPEGPPKKKMAKNHEKKWPKPRPNKSRPLPDWSTVPAKVSTHLHSRTDEARAANGSGDENICLPASERLMRRAIEQEERTVARLRKKQHAKLRDDGRASRGRSSVQQQQGGRQKQKRAVSVQRNFLARGKGEERLASQAEEARRNAARYKDAVFRLSAVAQAVDDVEREEAAERQRIARETDNGVNARDHWRSAGPVRLDPDGCIILEGPEPETCRPRARSAPARPRPVHAPSSDQDMKAGQPKNTSPPGYVKRMQQREMRAKGARPGDGGVHVWKQSLRDSEQSSSNSQFGQTTVGTKSKFLRKGGGRRALDGTVRQSESQQKQPQFDEEDEKLAAVLPGKAKDQSGLAAKWAHVPSRIRGQKPWQGRAATHRLASTEDMVDDNGQPLIEIMFEVGATQDTLHRSMPSESEREDAEREMRRAAEVFRDQERPNIVQETVEDEQWARYSVKP